MDTAQQNFGIGQFSHKISGAMLLKMRKNMPFPAVLVVCLFLLMYLIFPALLTALLILSLLGIIVHGIAPLFYFRRSAKTTAGRGLKKIPKVSIHIPCSNEPPALVIQTIKCCLASNYPNFEIVVLDNNTSKKHLWKPLESFCQKNSVIFKHFESLKGFKAGALNEALKLASPEAKYIFVCDADYCLDKNAISRAVVIAETEKVSLLQFPQAYRNVTPGNEDLDLEYFHYFQVYSNASNFNGNTLATGTLTLLNKSDLESLDGWRSTSITEDASMGVAFRDLGLTTKYVHERIGYGLMPETSRELKKQRTRWMFGNMQTVRDVLRSRMPIKDKLDCLLQLTAWINFLAVPFLALISYTILNLFFEVPDEYYHGSLIIGCFSSYLLLKFLVFSLSTGKVKPFLIHLSFIWEGAFCWWGALIGQSKPFHKTCKKKGKQENSFINIIPSLLFAFMAVVSFWEANWFQASFSFGFSMLFLKAGFGLSQQLFETRNIHLKAVRK